MLICVTVGGDVAQNNLPGFSCNSLTMTLFMSLVSSLHFMPFFLAQNTQTKASIENINRSLLNAESSRGKKVSIPTLFTHHGCVCFHLPLPSSTFFLSFSHFRFFLGAFVVMMPREKCLSRLAREHQSFRCIA